MTGAYHDPTPCACGCAACSRYAAKPFAGHVHDARCRREVVMDWAVIIVAVLAVVFVTVVAVNVR